MSKFAITNFIKIADGWFYLHRRDKITFEQIQQLIDLTDRDVVQRRRDREHFVLITLRIAILKYKIFSAIRW